MKLGFSSSHVAPSARAPNKLLLSFLTGQLAIASCTAGHITRKQERTSTSTRCERRSDSVHGFGPLLDPSPNPSNGFGSPYYWIDAIRARQAWDVRMPNGSRPVTIGIVDRGVDNTNQWLSSPPLSNPAAGGIQVMKFVRCTRTVGGQTQPYFSLLADRNPSECEQFNPTNNPHGTQVASILNSRLFRH